MGKGLAPDNLEEKLVLSNLECKLRGTICCVWYMWPV